MFRPKLTAFALAALGLLIGAGAAKAEVKIASIFTDHMVLQRDMNIPASGGTPWWPHSRFKHGPGLTDGNIRAGFKQTSLEANASWARRS
jgi:hypothetical protein